MRNFIKKNIKKLFYKLGFDIRNIDHSFFTLDKEFGETFKVCRPFTMTSLERMYALYKATEYVAKAGISGDIVECGVWKGGSAMLVAMTLMKFGCTDRKIFLYDTFEGMSEPSLLDVDSEGKNAEIFFNKTKRDNGSNWCYSPLDEVKKNLLATGYPEKNIIFVKGKVEDTIPGILPENICLLRLDTDWYDSTYHEMKHLFPILVKNGVLVLDDYGYWQGARTAVDKYLYESKINILLNKIDFSGRVGIKV